MATAQYEYRYSTRIRPYPSVQYKYHQTTSRDSVYQSPTSINLTSLRVLTLRAYEYTGMNTSRRLCRLLVQYRYRYNVPYVLIPVRVPVSLCQIGDILVMTTSKLYPYDSVLYKYSTCTGTGIVLGTRTSTVQLQLLSEFDQCLYRSTSTSTVLVLYKYRIFSTCTS